MSELSEGENHYRVVLACDGVPTHLGPQAAVDITREFTKRPWHDRVICTWNGHGLILQAENDFDPQGTALIDEFSDALAACIPDGFDGTIRVLSVAGF
jgi:hypothetical protein